MIKNEKPADRKIVMERTHLDFYFTFTVGLVAVGSVTPTLNKVPRTSPPGELNICRQSSFLCDGEIRARV